MRSVDLQPLDQPSQQKFCCHPLFVSLAQGVNSDPRPARARAPAHHARGLALGSWSTNSMFFWAKCLPNVAVAISCTTQPPRSHVSTSFKTRLLFSPCQNFPPCLHREQDPAHAWVASPNALMHHLWKCMEMIPHHYCLGPWVAFSMPTSALPAAHAEVNTEYQVQLMCWWPSIENVCCFGGVELPCFNDIESSWIIYGRHHPQKNKLAVDFQPHGVQSVYSKFQSCYTRISHFYKDLTGCVKEQWKNWCCRISGTFGPKPSKYLVCFAGFDHN